MKPLIIIICVWNCIKVAGNIIRMQKLIANETNEKKKERKMMQLHEQQQKKNSSNNKQKIWKWAWNLITYVECVSVSSVPSTSAIVIVPIIEMMQSSQWVACDRPMWHQFAGWWSHFVYDFLSYKLLAMMQFLSHIWWAQCVCFCSETKMVPIKRSDLYASDLWMECFSLLVVKIISFCRFYES